METFKMVFANLMGGLICLPFGLLLRTGKHNGLIDGYNTMTKKTQANASLDAVAKLWGNVMIAIAIILLLATIPILLGFYPMIMIWISLGISFVVLVAGLIYTNTSKKLKR